MFVSASKSVWLRTQLSSILSKVSSHVAAATLLQQRNSKAFDKSSVLQFPNSHLQHLEEFRGETRKLL